MPAYYPSLVKTDFTTKVDFVTTVFAEHVNSLQDEVTAIETTLGSLPTASSGWVGTFNTTTVSWSTLKARINNIEFGLKEVYDRPTTAAAGTLTGTTLASNVVSSSLTSVGTLATLTVSGTVTANSYSGSGKNLTGLTESDLGILVLMQAI